MKFKVDQKLRVIGEEKTCSEFGCHGFGIGEEVVVKHLLDEDEPNYVVGNERDYWYVHEDDLEAIE